MNDLGKRIKAARAYAGISQENLADSISISHHALQRIEAELDQADGSERWALIHAIAQATRLPEQWFTADFEALPREQPPEEKLDRLERKIDSALERMGSVADEADRQMTRGKEQLDRFIETQQTDRHLLREIAKRLDIPID